MHNQLNLESSTVSPPKNGALTVRLSHSLHSFNFCQKSGHTLTAQPQVNINLSCFQHSRQDVSLICNLKSDLLNDQRIKIDFKSSNRKDFPDVRHVVKASVYSTSCCSVFHSISCYLFNYSHRHHYQFSL